MKHMLGWFLPHRVRKKKKLPNQISSLTHGPNAALASL